MLFIAFFFKKFPNFLFDLSYTILSITLSYFCNLYFIPLEIYHLWKIFVK